MLCTMLDFPYSFPLSTYQIFQIILDLYFSVLITASLYHGFRYDSTILSRSYHIHVLSLVDVLNNTGVIGSIISTCQT